MKYLNCANITIPLCFIQSIAWTKKARTIQHYGGYISSRGFETAEISVKASFSASICEALGLSYNENFNNFENIKTDRFLPSGVFRIGGFPVYPELEFALTNINKTYVNDESTSLSPTIDIDMIFSGVKAVKNVNREQALSLDPSIAIPNVSIEVDGKSIKIQDMYQLNEFITTPDSISLDITIGSDMDLINRDDYFNRMVEVGCVYAELPQGTTRYYIIEASLVDETLSIIGSVYPHSAAQMMVKTYIDTDLNAIIKDIASIGGFDVDCRLSGKIDYYSAFGSPIECIKQLSLSAGFIISIRQNTITCVNVPEQIVGIERISYISMSEDGGSEPISGLYWYDGINKREFGSLNENSPKVYSCFRSAENFAQKCFRLNRYNTNTISILANLNTSLSSHSAITIVSNDTEVDMMCEFISFNWLDNTMEIEAHSLEA